MASIIILILHITAIGGIIMNAINPSVVYYGLVGYASLGIISVYNIVMHVKSKNSKSACNETDHKI